MKRLSRKLRVCKKEERVDRSRDSKGSRRTQSGKGKTEKDRRSTQYKTLNVLSRGNSNPLLIFVRVNLNIRIFLAEP